MYLFIIKSCEVSLQEFYVEEDSSIGSKTSIIHRQNIPTREELRDINQKADFVFFFEPLIKGMRVNYTPLLELNIEEGTILKKLSDVEKIVSSLPENEEIVFIDFSSTSLEEKNIVSLLTKLRLNFRKNTSFVFEGGYSSFLKGEYSLNFNPYDSPNIPLSKYSPQEKKKYISFLEELTYVCVRYLSMGFQNSETNYFDEIDDYFIFNLQSFPMKSLLEKYHLFSPYEYRRDIPIDEFIINEEYRRIITEYLCKVISNIAVHSKFPVINKSDGWYDEKYYLKIREYLLSVV